MNDKKYLDKVVKHLVRGTKIDYENEKLVSAFIPPDSSPFSNSSHPLYLIFPFAKYCKNMFGLTEEEIEYVHMVYMETLKDKIEDGQ